MPTSISAERSFYVLDRVKTKLRNQMGDERMSDLIMLASCPEIVETIDLISLFNKFVAKTDCTGKRLAFFGKFLPSDFH